MTRLTPARNRGGNALKGQVEPLGGAPIAIIKRQTRVAPRQRRPCEFIRNNEFGGALLFLRILKCKEHTLKTFAKKRVAKRQ